MPATQAVRSRAHHTSDDRQRLLPADLSAIRLLKLPDIGPPFDDDPVARAAVGGPALGTGATVPGHDATRTGPLAAVSAGAHPAGAVAGAAGPRPGQGAGGADGDWARQFARLLTEALSGARPVRQILPLTSERARVQLRALMPLFAGAQRPRMLRVIATRPTRDVIEMTAVVGVGARTRALAVRLERASGLGKATAPRWLCTDIEAA